MSESSRTNKLSAKILMIMIFKTITKLLHKKRILQAITERKKEKKEFFLLERKIVKLVELDFAFNLKSLFLRYDGWKSMICLARLHRFSRFQCATPDHVQVLSSQGTWLVLIGPLGILPNIYQCAWIFFVGGHFEFCDLKPHANGRNIVGPTTPSIVGPTMLGVIASGFTDTTCNIQQFCFPLHVA